MVLMLGIIVTAATGLALVGISVISNSETAADAETKVDTLVMFSESLDRLAAGEVQSRNLDFIGYSGDGGARVLDEGKLYVDLRDPDTGDVETVVIETDLGAVEYTNVGERIVYQSGGVWRFPDSDVGLNASTQVAPPSISYTAETVTIAPVHIRSTALDPTITTDATVSRTNASTVFPIDGDSARSNPTREATVTVRVQSKYYQAWGAYFESEFPTESGQAVVSYDHDANVTALQVHGDDVFLHVSHTSIIAE